MPDMTPEERATYHRVVGETMDTLRPMKRPEIIDYMYANHADGPFITTMRKAEMVKAVAHRVAGNKVMEMRRAARGAAGSLREGQRLSSFSDIVASEPTLQDLFRA